MLVQRTLRRINEATSTVTLRGGVRVPVALGRWRASWKTTLLCELLHRQEGVLVDVGANMGQTLLDYFACDTDTGYIGFEPLPEPAALLQRVIDLNGRSDAILVPVALSDESGARLIHIPEDDDTSATLDGGLRPGRPVRSLMISCHPFDLVWPRVAQGRSVGVVKIDVEGTELAAMQGMHALLAADRPWVICEVLDADARADPDVHGARLVELEALLDEIGYSIERIVKPSGRYEGLAPVAAFPRRTWQPDTAEECDYLLRPA